MPTRMPTVLVRLAAAWTAIGLASGLFYREFTKANDVAGGTQLAVVHTHTLTLGTLVLLLLLALVLALPALTQDRRMRWAVWVWQAGLVLTTGGMLVKGSLQVLGREAANSPAIAGVSGLGHMTLTAAFILLFLALTRAVRALEQSPAEAATEPTAGDVATGQAAALQGS